MLFFFLILAYFFLMSLDFNLDIRRIVLFNIVFSVKILLVVLVRIRDVRDSVRKIVYIVMGEKIYIKVLLIVNRVRLLYDGLIDRLGIYIRCIVCGYC